MNHALGLFRQMTEQEREVFLYLIEEEQRKRQPKRGRPRGSRNSKDSKTTLPKILGGAPQ